MNRTLAWTVGMAVTAGFAWPGIVAAQHGHDHHGPGHHAPGVHSPNEKALEEKPVGDPYPLGVDALTGEELGDNPVVVEHDGRELRFTSEKSAAAFRAEPGRYLAQLDERIAKDQLRFYALDKCVISGQPLDSMGKPDDFVFRNRLVRLCCPHCRDSVEKDAADVLAKLDAAAIEKQKGDYPLEDCVISGHAITTMGEPYDVVIAGRLVRLCCEQCEGELREHPLVVLSQIEEARARRDEAAATAGHGQ